MYVIEEDLELDLDLPRGFIFDIETTGLSYNYHRLAMVGYLYQESGRWVMRQELASSREDEKLLLLNFMRLSQNFLYTVHYNGQSFDLPFVNKRSQKLGLSQGFDARRGFDLYLHLKRKKTPGKLGLNQQEKRAGYQRRDRLSGKDWVENFHHYEKTQNPTSRELLLLHNRDDLLGTAYLAKLEEDFRRDIDARLYRDSLILQAYPGQDEIRLLLYNGEDHYLDLPGRTIDGLLFSESFSDDLSSEEKRDKLLAYEKKCFYQNIKRELELL